MTMGFCHISYSHTCLKSPALSIRKVSSINNHKQTQNRYDRFRLCLKPKTHDTDPNESVHKLMEVAKSTMEVLSSNRRAFNRTWSRMSPLLELVVSTCSSDDDEELGFDTTPKTQSTHKLRSIADVGCDHGLLSLSLASMAWSASQTHKEGKENNVDSVFLSKVTGTDLSPNALNGALLSLDKINKTLSRMPTTVEDDKITVSIDFRVGDGLEPLQIGEADGIILAGMGVHTMIEILTGSNALDRLGTNHLFLQPTNSRPRHLLMIYDALQSNYKWQLMEEAIVFLGGRWYISSYFRRRQTNAMETASAQFPGYFLTTKDSDGTRATYNAYVKHHIEWLKQDYTSRKGALEPEDVRWLEHFCNEKVYSKWKDACEWYSKDEM